MGNGRNTRNNGTRQNNKTADRKVESNDSPEIPQGGDMRNAWPPLRQTDRQTETETDRQRGR